MTRAAVRVHCEVRAREGARQIGTSIAALPPQPKAILDGGAGGQGCRYAQRTFGVTLALQRDTERPDQLSGGPVERPTQRSGNTVGAGANQRQAEPRCLQPMHMSSPVGEKVHARFHNQPLKRFC